MALRVGLVPTLRPVLMLYQEIKWQLGLLAGSHTKEKPECIASVLDGKIDASIG